MELERRRLGRTGHQSTVVTFGSAGIGRVEQDVADRAIQTALDYGVNHFDVAPTYGEAELRLAPWMPRIREGIFLGCKTTEQQTYRPVYPVPPPDGVIAPRPLPPGPQLPPGPGSRTEGRADDGRGLQVVRAGRRIPAHGG